MSELNNPSGKFDTLQYIFNLTFAEIWVRGYPPFHKLQIIGFDLLVIWSYGVRGFHVASREIIMSITFCYAYRDSTLVRFYNKNTPSFRKKAWFDWVQFPSTVCYLESI